MTRLSSFCLALFLPTSLTSAWSLLWANETVSRLITGTGEQNCTEIWHEEGYTFSFDPEGPWCLNFWHEAACSNTIGITCEGYQWTKTASQNISAFNVYAMPPASLTAWGFASSTTTTTSSPSSSSSSSSFTSSASSTTTTTTTTTTTETPLPTAPAEATPSSAPAMSSNNSLGGGAIGGIVIGVVVAVALLCALFFWLGRRLGRADGLAEAEEVAAPPPFSPQSPKNEPSLPPSSSSPSISGPPTIYPSVVSAPPDMAKPPIETPMSQYFPSPVTHFPHPSSGTRMVELPVQGREVALSTSQVQPEEDQVSRYGRF